MSRRASSASEGEVTNTNGQHGKSRVDSSDRSFGLDGASDRHDGGRNGRSRFRALSRSPSPYRPNRARSPSPYRPSRARSPSPHRKKRADDRSPSPYYRSSRTGHDSRSSNKRADDRSPSPHRRSRNGHDDRSSNKRADDRSRSPHRFSRNGHDDRSYNKRKTSPPRGHRPEKRLFTDRNRNGDSQRGSYAEDTRAGPPRTTFENERDRPLPQPISYAEVEHPKPVPDFRAGLKIDNRSQKPGNHEQRHKTRQPNPQERQPPVNRSQAKANQPSVSKDVEMKSTNDVTDYTLAPVEEKVPTEESRAEKKRRWAAIRAAEQQKAKEKAKENLLQQAILTNASEATTPNIASPAPYADSPISPFPSPRNGDLGSVPASPDVMIIDKQGGVNEKNTSSPASPSAADYNPMQDMLDDRDRAAKKTQNPELPSAAYNETDPKVLSTLPAEKVIPVKKQKELDMFAESDDESEDGVVETAIDTTTKGTVLDEKLLDNWDDHEGYYKLINNELVDGGRYRVIKGLGRGVYANVARAEEVTTDGKDQTRKLVAIKMIRRNEFMRKQSQKEIDVCKQVNEADPYDKRHIIRVFNSFDHKGHLCIVFEHMSKNLRDLLKEDTNGRGLALPAVRLYFRQMLSGLEHLQQCQIIHLDLKPDNVLVSPDHKTIKLADFGTAVFERDLIDRTAYLVSRFYRAPEIILGMKISYGVDIWATGCTAYELWTGKILFTGRSNNQMVKSFIDCLGWPSEKLLKKGIDVLHYFEPGPPLRFISFEVDQNNHVRRAPIYNLDQLTNSHQANVRKIEQQKKIARDLKARIYEAARGITTNGPSTEELNEFAHLLGACLHMNVEKRFQPKEALNHKFFAPIAPKVPSTSAAGKQPLLKRTTAGLFR
ncbi:U4/U6 small nuclear ribonucleoprotein prp4 [Neocucurbitaria cava]|uniref:U4/U6 small nuclear ribonucleoprotein prp4 n=1 Tax=Neocucurbitaria cava TaxID=798079 RepID=A0A9W8YHT7_9PLEO|nr:U4/U6 small nuclear ribonucleoprotein prp4 [Neocucurbitaria cava]